MLASQREMEIIANTLNRMDDTTDIHNYLDMVVNTEIPVVEGIFVEGYIVALSMLGNNVDRVCIDTAHNVLHGHNPHTGEFKTFKLTDTVIEATHEWLVKMSKKKALMVTNCMHYERKVKA